VALFEPTVIPGLDRALIEIVIAFAAIVCGILAVTIGSTVGAIRAIRRRRSRKGSRSAIALALVAAIITLAWLLYWMADNIYHRHNPLDALFAINLGLWVLPCGWLLAAWRAHRSALH
jgi:hypothetical protein